VGDLSLKKKKKNGRIKIKNVPRKFGYNPGIKTPIYDVQQGAPARPRNEKRTTAP